MSNDTHKADQIAFHFYTKLFYTVNHARATEDSSSTSRVDKWFNLETPDSDLFTKEAREPYRSISLAPRPGPPPLEIQVLLSIPELTNNQVLVYMAPDSSRVRIEPTPRFILLETWTLAVNPASNQHGDSSTDVALPIIYKHGIVLFRSVFSLLRVLPAWKFYKRLKRRVHGNGNLAIKLRVRSHGDSESILGFDSRLSPTYRSSLPTSTHTFPSVAHLLGSFTLSTTHLTTPNFQLDELESLLSSRFISLDLEGFIPTLDKNRQRDSITGSSLPSSRLSSRSPPKPTVIGRVTSGTTADSMSVAERFIIPSRVPSIGATANTGSSALIPPPRPFPNLPPAQPIPASGLAINRLRKESLNSSASSSASLPLQGQGQGMSSLSSSPVTGPLPIRRPNINPVHPFKSNTLSSASGSSPSLSIRQGAVGSPAGLSGAAMTHSRQGSSASPIPGGRLPPSPIGGGFSAHPSPPSGATTFAPSSLGDRRPGTSGSGASSDRDRRFSLQATAGGGDSDDGHGRGPLPMAVPPRKRYSSSFGHRYTGSVGSGTGAVGVGSGGGGDASTPGSGGDASGRATPASAQEGRKESASFLSATTDDDDISIFVQDIDSRKPLSGRAKEREKRDRDREALEEQERREWHHGRDTTDGTDTTIKGKQKEGPPSRYDLDMATVGRRPLGLDGFADDAPYVTSPLPPQDSPNYSELGMASPSSASAAERAAQLSTSPTRGPMLTSQDEVEERLKKMNETFLKSLEGISGSTRRKDKRRDVLQGVDDSSTSSPTTADNREQDDYIPSNSINNNPSRASRGLGLQLGFPPTRPGSGSGSERELYPSYPYNTPGLGLGLGRGRHASTSSSTLGTSEAGASQGSEEVIGRMELYDERRRSGLQG